MKRLLHEAMDHGACGWSAQRLGRNSVQADFDGSPMVTDFSVSSLVKIAPAANLPRSAVVVGPENGGLVIQGLARRIDKSLRTFAVEDPAGLSAALKEVTG